MPGLEPYVPRDEMFLWWLADPARPRLVGDLALVARGRDVAFRYAPSWLDDGLALSEDLPLETRQFLPATPDSAAGAVDDARPDRWGERVIRILDKPKRLSLLEYLYFAGDDRFGALGVSLSRDVYSPHAVGALPSLADIGDVHRIVVKVATGAPVDERERRLVNPGRSMGGAKPKSLVVIDGAQWVLKFADAYDLDWPRIEHATMRLARAAGIDACETRALPFAPGRSAVAVRRFDRGAAGRRLHGVSAAVVLRAAGEDAGYPELASVFRRLLAADVQAAARVELFVRMVFNIVCDNTDDHERNHAVIHTGDGDRLAPAFDVAPTLTNLGQQALRVGKAENDSTLDNALSECKAFGLSVDAAVGCIRRVCGVVEGWRPFMVSAGVADREIAALEPVLDGDKAAMRREMLTGIGPTARRRPRRGV